MLNFNGRLIPENEFKLQNTNRAFKYGDGLFDTLKSEKGKISYLEDHYFRLMASMRMLRMDIPMNFTLSFYEEAIKKTLEANKISGNGRIRVTVFRKDGGFYLPEDLGINFLIEVYPFEVKIDDIYEIELYKDFPVTTGLLGTLKTTNRLINVLAGIYADENEYDNCILLNDKKNVAEAINANIFIVKNGTVSTPSLSEGCVKGIIRMKIIQLLKKDRTYRIEEREISPFELMHADEVFLTNSLFGVKSVTKFRKKDYKNEAGMYVSNLLEKDQL